MKLKIDAFRSLQNREYDFPNSGLVRLAGVSGAGKSTLFDALEFLFWGGAGNTSPYGLKKTKVSMEWRGLSATRSKYPDKLIVNDNVDDSAQETIRGFLGVSEAQFGCSGYVRQDMSSGILAMSPADQLRLIQNLAFDSVDPENYKNKVKVFISETSTAVTATESKVSSLRTQLERLESRLAHEAGALTSVPVVEPEPSLSAPLPQLEKEIADQKSRVDELSRRMCALVQELNAPERALDTQIAGAGSEMSVLERQIEELRSEIGRFPRPSAGELRSVENRVGQLTRDASAHQSRQAAVSDLRVCEERLESARRALSSSSANGTFTREKLMTLRGSLDRELQEARTRATPMPCPSCGAHLTLKDSTLVHAGAPGPSVDECKSKILRIDQKLSEIAAAVAAVDGSEAQVAAVRSRLSTLPEVQFSQEALDAANDELAMMRLAESNHQGLLRRIERLQTELSEKVAKLEGLRRHRASLMLRDPSVIQTDMASTSTEMEVASSRISSVENSVDAHRRWQARVQEQMIAAARRAEQEIALRRLSAEIDETRASIKAAESYLSTLISRVAAAQRLLPMITEASTRTIGSVVAAINDSANTWVERFFPRTGTRVMLRNVKVNKDDTRRAQMSTVVFQDGHECRLQDMSGGERSRIVLAFQLAMSTMFKCPILLLDEPFKGLDPELREGCMEALQEFAVDRLVMVAEHTIDDSWFEHVVRP